MSGHYRQQKGSHTRQGTLSRFQERANVIWSDGEAWGRPACMGRCPEVCRLRERKSF